MIFLVNSNQIFGKSSTNLVVKYNREMLSQAFDSILHFVVYTTWTTMQRDNMDSTLILLSVVKFSIDVATSHLNIIFNNFYFSRVHKVVGEGKIYLIIITIKLKNS